MKQTEVELQVAKTFDRPIIVKNEYNQACMSFLRCVFLFQFYIVNTY